MRHNARRSRYTPSSGGGSFWLSFSDLMSALLLVFVLVMFYSVYQYLDMLEIKTAELMRQSGLLDQKEIQLTEQAQALDEKDAQLQASQSKLSESEQALVTQQARLLLFQQELDSSEALLAQQREELESTRSLVEAQQQTVDEQQALLDAQRLKMDEQQALLNSQQGRMDEQQSLLDAQQGQMDQQQALLSDAQARLADQQNQMDRQQQKLDALVGVRARIISGLAGALSDANIRATVDPATGAITMDASVFFDVGKSELKAEGQRMLDRFLPVYLSVLMDNENSSSISEIIIEGHTDTDGSYMSNLKLSQERALSVMEYVLGDDFKGITGGMKRRLRQIATANGRSYSNPVYAADGSVDKTASRRVEFKFRLQDEQMIEDMRSLLEDMNG